MQSYALRGTPCSMLFRNSARRKDSKDGLYSWHNVKPMARRSLSIILGSCCKPLQGGVSHVWLGSSPTSQFSRFRSWDCWGFVIICAKGYDHAILLFSTNSSCYYEKAGFFQRLSSIWVPFNIRSVELFIVILLGLPMKDFFHMSDGETS